MSRASDSGQRGEDIALSLLISKGYTLIERNFTTRYGEIDLIVADGGDTVFVEVKTRRSAKYSTAAGAVTTYKQRRLRDTASEWLARHTEVPARFDVIEVYLGGEKPQVRHIKNAF